MQVDAGSGLMNFLALMFGLLTQEAPMSSVPWKLPGHRPKKASLSISDGFSLVLMSPRCPRISLHTGGAGVVGGAASSDHKPVGGIGVGTATLTSAATATPEDDAATHRARDLLERGIREALLGRDTGSLMPDQESRLHAVEEELKLLRAERAQLTERMKQITAGGGPVDPVAARNILTRLRSGSGVSVST